MFFGESAFGDFLFQLRIGLLEFPRPQEDPSFELFVQLPHFLGARLQRLLGVPALGQVAHQHETAFHVSIFTMRNVGRVNEALAGVLIADLAFIGDDQAGKSLLDIGKDDGRGIVPQHVTDALAVDVLPAASEPVFIGAVIEPEALVPVDIGDQDRQGIGEKLKLNLLAARVLARMGNASVRGTFVLW